MLSEAERPIDGAVVDTANLPVDQDGIGWQAYESEIFKLCAVKAEEFRLLGYEEVTPKDVWNCVLSKAKNVTRLHDMVGRVLSLNAGVFMNFMTMSAFQGRFG